MKNTKIEINNLKTQKMQLDKLLEQHLATGDFFATSHIFVSLGLVNSKISSLKRNIYKRINYDCK